MNQEVSILASVKDVKLIPAAFKSGNPPYDRLAIVLDDGFAIVLRL